MNYKLRDHLDTGNWEKYKRNSGLSNLDRWMLIWMLSLVAVVITVGVLTL